MNPPKTAWHHFSPEALQTHLNVDIQQGLKETEAQRRLDQYGPNCLTPRRGKSPLRLLLEQFHQPLVYILLVAAAVTAFLQEWVDSSVIFGVVLVNAIIGFIQEANALKAIDALSRMLTITSTVLRDGQRRAISADELVPGDVVLLQSGDKVPADLRLLQIRELQIDESALTGESVPVEKRLATLEATTVLADRCNMAYSSTLVTYGSGLGVVVESGDRTEIGLINRMIASATDLETPLTQKNQPVQSIVVVGHYWSSRCNFCCGSLARSCHAGHVHGRRSAGGWCNSRRFARRFDDYLGDRRLPDGEAQCHYSQTAGSGNPGQHHRDLFRQNRHADAKSDDCASAVCGRRIV